MHSRFARLVVLLMLAALLVNAQCYGSCVTASVVPAPSDSSGCCPHHQPQPAPETACVHQHMTFAGPEPGARPVLARTAHSGWLHALPAAPPSLSLPPVEIAGSYVVSPPPPRVRPASAVLRV